MKLRRYILLTAIAGLMSCMALYGQSRHEFSIHGGGGLSTLKYDMSTGKFNNGFGGLFGVGYSYFFTDNFGLHTGIEASLYNSKATISSLGDRNMIYDRDDVLFEYRNTVSNYSEKQHAYFLNIPLQFQLQTSGVNRFYGLLGAKIGIPLSGRYNSTGDFTNSGYYEYEDFLYDNFPVMGFGTFRDRKEDGSFGMKAVFMASAEAGMKWALNNGMSLYTGVYFDYGLNDIISDVRTKRFIVYNTQRPTEFFNNTVMTSQYNASSSPTARQDKSFTEKTIPMAVGIKLRLAFGKGRTAESFDPIEPEPFIPDTVIIEKTMRDTVTIVVDAPKPEPLPDNVLQIMKEPIANFPLNVSKLNTEHYEVLDRKIQMMEAYPAIKILINEGHGCEIGNDFVNQVIGLKRAEAARQYMVGKGIDEERIYTLTKGKTEHISPNDTEANRRKNRRVEFKVITEGPITY